LQTDLVLAQKDARGKFGHPANDLQVFLATQYFSNHTAIYSSVFGNQIAIKVQNFALT
jgi:hypothetical protein